MRLLHVISGDEAGGPAELERISAQARASSCTQSTALCRTQSPHRKTSVDSRLFARISDKRYKTDKDNVGIEKSPGIAMGSVRRTHVAVNRRVQSGAAASLRNRSPHANVSWWPFLAGTYR